GGLCRRICRHIVAADRRARVGDHLMAANAGTPVIGKRKHHRQRVMSEINVTPTVGVPIDLPQSQAKSLEQDKEPLTVSVNEKGQIFLQNSEIAADDLIAKMEAVAQARGGKDARVYVRGDKRVDYGTMMKVMGRLSSAGFNRVALVTEF